MTDHGIVADHASFVCQQRLEKFPVSALATRCGFPRSRRSCASVSASLRRDSLARRKGGKAAVRNRAQSGRSGVEPPETCALLLRRPIGSPPAAAYKAAVRSADAFVRAVV